MALGTTGSSLGPCLLPFQALFFLLLFLAGMVDSWVVVGEEGKVLLVEIRLLVKMVNKGPQHREDVAG